MTSLFLPGVAAAYVRRRLEQAGGNEIGSGKFAHPESSAALAANTFGWFIDRQTMLPPLPGAEFTGQAEQIEIEYCARLPWVGGRHPWLDAAVISATHLIGIESKRFEPFRDAKAASFSAAYDQPVWGDRMERYSAVRDALRLGVLRYRHLSDIDGRAQAAPRRDHRLRSARGWGRGCIRLSKLSRVVARRHWFSGKPRRRADRPLQSVSRFRLRWLRQTSLRAFWPATERPLPRRLGQGHNVRVERDADVATSGRGFCQVSRQRPVCSSWAFG
jgi:hypothetical protein